MNRLPKLACVLVVSWMTPVECFSNVGPEPYRFPLYLKSWIRFADLPSTMSTAGESEHSLYQQLMPLPSLLRVHRLAQSPRISPYLAQIEPDAHLFDLFRFVEPWGFQHEPGTISRDMLGLKVPWHGQGCYWFEDADSQPQSLFAFQVRWESSPVYPWLGRERVPPDVRPDVLAPLLLEGPDELRPLDQRGRHDPF